jgi:hypothetical protein
MYPTLAFSRILFLVRITIISHPKLSNVFSDFTGHQTRELLGERDPSMAEAAAIIGKAIGEPSLDYVQTNDEQLRPALIQMGMPGNMADLILEMEAALNSGHMRALEPRSPANTTPTSYETFVEEEFLPLYHVRSEAA